MAKSEPSIGAGGFWPTIGERHTRAIKQQVTPVACAYACVQLLARRHGINIAQNQIADNHRVDRPANPMSLADKLRQYVPNQRWRSHYTQGTPDVLMALRQRCPFIAGLRSIHAFPHGAPIPPEHAVVVRQIMPRRRRVRIHDPFDPSQYEMTFDDFLESWTSFVAFAENP